MKRARVVPLIPAAGAVAAGRTLPSSPVAVFGEDFSLIIRSPRRMRIARGHIRVLS